VAALAGVAGVVEEPVVIVTEAMVLAPQWVDLVDRTMTHLVSTVKRIRMPVDLVVVIEVSPTAVKTITVSSMMTTAPIIIAAKDMADSAEGEEEEAWGAIATLTTEVVRMVSNNISPRIVALRFYVSSLSFFDTFPLRRTF
jgi:hypothetical protein